MPFIEVKIDDSDEETKKRKKSSDGKDDSLLLRECYGCCIVVDASTGMLSKCLKCEKSFASRVTFTFTIACITALDV